MKNFLFLAATCLVLCATSPALAGPVGEIRLEPRSISVRINPGMSDPEIFAGFYEGNPPCSPERYEATFLPGTPAVLVDLRYPITGIPSTVPARGVLQGWVVCPDGNRHVLTPDLDRWDIVNFTGRGVHVDPSTATITAGDPIPPEVTIVGETLDGKFVDLRVTSGRNAFPFLEDPWDDNRGIIPLGEELARRCQVEYFYQTGPDKRSYREFRGPILRDESGALFCEVRAPVGEGFDLYVMFPGFGRGAPSPTWNLPNRIERLGQTTPGDFIVR